MSTGRPNRTRTAGFTLLELTVVVIIIVVLITLLLPALNGGGPPARRTENASRLRGIHQNLVIFAQGTNGYYPGHPEEAAGADLTVESRFEVLLTNQYFTGDYIVSPGESLKAWQGGPVVAGKYSYAMLQIDSVGRRRDEWRDTMNSHAFVLGDRNVGTDAGKNVQSIWTQSVGEWRGNVAWNDNHVTYETIPMLPQTKYGLISADVCPEPSDEGQAAPMDDTPSLTDDNLFLPGDAKDATTGQAAHEADDGYLIHSGQ